MIIPVLLVAQPVFAPLLVSPVRLSPAGRAVSGSRHALAAARARAASASVSRRGSRAPPLAPAPSAPAPHRPRDPLPVAAEADNGPATRPPAPESRRPPPTCLAA